MYVKEEVIRLVNKSEEEVKEEFEKVNKIAEANTLNMTI